jgi:hypothetical protein
MGISMSCREYPLDCCCDAQQFTIPSVASDQHQPDGKSARTRAGKRYGAKIEEVGDHSIADQDRVGREQGCSTLFIESVKQQYPAN